MCGYQACVDICMDIKYVLILNMCGYQICNGIKYVLISKIYCSQVCIDT